MIKSPEVNVSAPGIDISFRRPPLSEPTPLHFGIGDPTFGPLIGLFCDAPATPEQLAAPPDLAPAHGHQCDTFRIVMRGELWVGAERYHHGEFRLQRSGRPYGRDGDAPHHEGNWRIIMFGDRRGHRVRPTNPELRAQRRSPEALDRIRQRYGDIVPDLLDDDDNGVQGLATTIQIPFSKMGHIDASFRQSETWNTLGGTTHLAVSLLSMPEIGPVVILQRTAAGALATPAATFDSDVYRCVIAGSHLRSGDLVEMGDGRFQVAGEPWEAVTAGPDGLDELIIIGHRGGAIPEVTADSIGWQANLVQIMADLRADMAALGTPRGAPPG